MKKKQKGLLQNLKRQATAPSYFGFMTHLKDVSRLKGAICGNPALQGGGRRLRKSIRLKDGTRLEEVIAMNGDRSESPVFQTAFSDMHASSPL